MQQMQHSLFRRFKTVGIYENMIESEVYKKLKSWKLRTLHPQKQIC